MVIRPNVKSEIDFWNWVGVWPSRESIYMVALDCEHRPDDYDKTEAWDADPSALHLLFGYRHYTESEWPHAAWSDMADSIYFAIKRLDYFDVHWRVKPEIDASMSFIDHRMVRQSYVRLTVVPRERPEVLPATLRSADRESIPTIQSRLHEQDVAGRIAPEIHMWSHNTKTGVVTEPQKVMWSGVGDPTSWNIGVDSAVTPRGEVVPIPHKQPSSGFVSLLDVLSDTNLRIINSMGMTDISSIIVD